MTSQQIGETFKTYREIMTHFNELYPDLTVIDFRPACFDFVTGMPGLTIWLDNGDVLLYFPRLKEEDQNAGRE